MNKLVNSLIKNTHPQWHPILGKALEEVNEDYLKELHQNNQWLPGINNLLAAFSLPLDKTNYLLLGESPYPRLQSANGYAFWDAAVQELWSPKGLSKEVNRATSLRNWIKMLLVARGDLKDDLSQMAIAKLDKSHFCQTGNDFFTALISKGFLLLNASLVYSENEVRTHARQWKPFMHSLLDQLAEYKPTLQLLLFGNIAKEIPQTKFSSCLIAEHPYNLSFINNPQVLEFFKPLDLLNDYENKTNR
ncbi:uracil-DNA glycosylase family protein [Legionella hackeliae]|uniref:Uracil-DNA glycosylase n=1 Tax=Legionella hackeliae TaxID=449 RepID=A0A0A8USK6_LEGHA|nr:uracil-DNA glycosylase family protein [Legionella hackeliae]KTD13796.1 uracil DNA glycosylase [Legionella hackeliae]CEK10496.1 Uracil-DNA glycosylase [Legionella hackeliae]STX47234.1 uracil-DNA glycosylase [Legionella hackeliae]